MKRIIGILLSVLIIGALLTGCEKQPQKEDDTAVDKKQDEIKKSENSFSFTHEEVLSYIKDQGIVNATDKEQMQTVGSDSLYYVESEEGGTLFTVTYTVSQASGNVTKIQLAVTVQAQADMSQHLSRSIQKLMKLADESLSETQTQQLLEEIAVSDTQSEGVKVQNNIQYMLSRTGEIETFTVAPME